MDKIEVTRIYLGEFNINSGKVIATDPCYEPGQWYNKELNIKPGEYICHAVYGDVGYGWGERVVELYINHESTPKKKATKYAGSCGVDSGQCGFFEAENYDRVHPKAFVDEDEVSQKWYNEACDITCDGYAHCVGIMPDELGVVASSGLGDGCYTLYAGYNSKGEITALRLRFL